MSATGTNGPAFVGPPLLRLDLPRGSAQPRAWRWVIATAAAVAVSLLACFALARLAIGITPTLAGYEHFQFADYSKLTIIGVVVACVGWPALAWLSTNARRLYLWAGIVVTVVSLAPDVWILHLGQPVDGVVTLVAMHIALAVVTIPAMIFLAPQQKAAMRA